MKYHLLTLALSGALITGCASAPVPQTATEHKALFKKPVTYQVNRPYSDVVATLKKQSKQCLDVRLRKKKCINLSCQEYDVYYRPTLRNGKSNTELQVQYRRDPWNSVFVGGGRPPKEGLYIFVFDIEPAGKSKTQMTVFGTTNKTLQTVPDAVKHWAKGDNLGCPDFGKTYFY